VHCITEQLFDADRKRMTTLRKIVLTMTGRLTFSLTNRRDKVLWSTSNYPIL
jgi:hypothetical protein